MDKRLKRGMLLITFGVLLYAISTNLASVFGGIKAFFAMIQPVAWGLVFAFVLNVPMSALEKLFTKITDKWKHKPKKLVIRIVSLIITLAILSAIIVFAAVLVVPNLFNSFVRVYDLVTEAMPDITERINGWGLDTGKMLQTLLDKIFDAMDTLTERVLSLASDAVSGVVNIILALVVAIYAVVAKDVLLRQSNRALFAIFRPSSADKIVRVSKLTSHTFSKFIAGQGVESLILGTLIFITFTIFGIPNALVIAFVTFISAYVPYVGAFSACAIGAFLTLIEAPEKVILCIIVFIATQFIEDHFIYPHIVGNSVGLPAIWTLAAVILGGNFFGLLGMIFFIPLAAVIYTLLRNAVNRKIDKRKSEYGHIDELIDEIPPEESEIPEELKDMIEDYREDEDDGDVIIIEKKPRSSIKEDKNDGDNGND